MDFLSWHYVEGWRWYWSRVWLNLKRLFHHFSFSILVKTLFWPWKRLVESEETGMDVAKFFEKVSFNMISVMMGMMVRSVLILVALVMGLVYLILSMVFFLVWWIFPLSGLAHFARDQRRLENVLNRLVANIGKRPNETGRIIMESEPGKFVLERMEYKIEEILKMINVDEEDVKNFDGSSFEKIMEWFLSKNEAVEGELQKLEMSKSDLVLAANWWDKRRILAGEREGRKWDLGRPGIGWDLLFGYTPKLNKFSEDLSLKQTFAEHLIGRETVVKRMETIMNSDKNILLVGEPGVGKMTVVYEFADRAITGKLGRKLMYKKLVNLNYQMAMAGNGDKDSKKKVLSDLMKEAEAAGNIILVIKDLFRITNADFEGNDYADVIDNILRKNQLKIMGVVGRVEYERFMAGDARILRNFEVIEVLPPSKEEAWQILVRAVERVESTMKLKFSLQALKQIIDGSDKYITETPFPEKALELMDQVVMAEENGDGWIKLEEVNKTLSEKTGIMVSRLTEGEKDKLGKLEEIMSQELIGQTMAVQLIAKSLRSRVVAVKNEERPVGSFLFLGPTGVGKTQAAKVLADVYYGSRKNILRFDMAEYVGAEGLARLVGSVEKNQPGMMTTEIKNRPASLLLLDEIEKAPPEIYNLFLAMLDEGYINDASGNKVICRHLFVVATSNAGAEFIRQQVKNGIKGEELQKSVVDYVQKERIFSPEFLNRFDGVVVFEPLDEETLVAVARLMLKEVQENMLKKSINVEFDEGVARKVAKDGYTIEFGARPMRREVDLVLGDILGKAILENKIKPGDKIRIVAGEGSGEYLINQ